MPRKERIDAPGALHPIIIRGIEQSLIFTDDRDRENFLERPSHLFTESQPLLLCVGADEQSILMLD
jgi:hypothetical protein